MPWPQAEHNWARAAVACQRSGRQEQGSIVERISTSVVAITVSLHGTLSDWHVRRDSSTSALCRRRLRLVFFCRPRGGGGTAAAWMPRSVACAAGGIEGAGCQAQCDVARGREWRSSRPRELPLGFLEVQSVASAGHCIPGTRSRCR